MIKKGGFPFKKRPENVNLSYPPQINAAKFSRAKKAKEDKSLGKPLAPACLQMRRLQITARNIIVMAIINFIALAVFRNY